MRTFRSILFGVGGLRLTCYAVLPDTQPKALVALLHGYGDHFWRYRHVTEALVEHGFAVYGLDHRGHGQSAGVRADVERFNHYVDDARQMTDKARAEYPGLPLFMLGQSMGGLLAVHYALRYQDDLRGLVLTSPALMFGEDVSPLIKKLSGVLAQIVPRRVVVPPASNSESVLSRDPTVQLAFDGDPLTYKGGVRARMGYQLLRAATEARARCHELAVPLLVMYGDADRYVNPSGAKLLYEQAQSADKTIRGWPDHRHEIFNELERDDVIAALIAWLDQRVAQPANQPQAAQES